MQWNGFFPRLYSNVTPPFVRIFLDICIYNYRIEREREHSIMSISHYEQLGGTLPLRKKLDEIMEAVAYSFRETTIAQMLNEAPPIPPAPPSSNE